MCKKMNTTIESILYGTVGVALLALINSLLSLGWSSIFIITRYFGWSLFIIKENDIIITICKNTIFSSLRNDCDEPLGIIFGSKFIGHIAEYDNRSKVIYLLCGNKQLEMLKKKNNSSEVVDNDTKEPIICYTRRQPRYEWTYYKRVMLKYHHNFLITDEQQKTIDDITYEYKTSHNHNFTCLITGPSGTGKSTVSFLVAQSLAGFLCNTYSPTSPGDTLLEMYSAVGPSINKPLVVIINEVDVLLEQIKKNKIVQHKNCPIEVHNKSTWNNLFDSIDVGMYPFMIVILTSNKPYSKIVEDGDNSYLRKGRINCSYHFTEKVVKSV